eukprot:92216-Rhodomonas_salina.4
MAGPSQCVMADLGLGDDARVLEHSGGVCIAGQEADARRHHLWTANLRPRASACLSSCRMLCC